MPIFEYRCDGCGERFERIVLGNSPKIQCPQCSGAQVQKQISAFAVSGSSASPGNGQRGGDCACNPGAT